MVLSRSIPPPLSAEGVVLDEQSISFSIVSVSTSIQLETLSTAELLTTSSTVSLLLSETTARRCGAEKILSILHQQKFDPKLSEKKIMSLEQCGNNAKDIANGELNNI